MLRSEDDIGFDRDISRVIMIGTLKKGVDRQAKLIPTGAGESDVLDRVGFLVRRTQQIIVAAFMKENAESDLTPAQFAVMVAIASRPGIDQIRLASLLALDPSTAGDVIRRLQRRKILTREKDPTDRRSRILKLTVSGTKLLSVTAKGVERAREQALRPLSVAERRLLVRLLQKLVAEADAADR